ncbi:hypothetical protein K474DRAFT_1708847 [Panus rudis PR-1116 ss-1]|nr:hypothetical protein K474DRAFT_1708847 [Panus rudis PR-1116 ss-1]
MLSSYALSLPLDSDPGVATFKTPGRAAHKSHKTPGRTIARNRAALQENAAHYGVTMTVNRKAKSALHTPFRHPGSQQKHAQTAMKPSFVISRPLGDKTPFPNRHQNAPPLQTPAPRAGKMAKLSLLEAQPEMEPLMPINLLRPSSTRKSLRSPRMSGGGGNYYAFKTPITNGNHWDVSEGDIEVNVPAETEDADLQIDDYDEIEYMPPKVPEQPYEPCFSMPDYKHLGHAVLDLSHTCHLDDSADVRFAREIAQEIDSEQLLSSSGAFNTEYVALPELGDEDDPFQSTVQEPPETSSSTLPTRGAARSTVPSRQLSATRAATAIKPHQPTQATTARSRLATLNKAATAQLPSVANTRPNSASSSSSSRAPSRTAASGGGKPPFTTSSAPSSKPSVNSNKNPVIIKDAKITSKPTVATASSSSGTVGARRLVPTVPRTTVARSATAPSIRGSKTASTGAVSSAKAPLTRSKSTAATKNNASPTTSSAESGDGLFVLSIQDGASTDEDFMFSL